MVTVAHKKLYAEIENKLLFNFVFLWTCLVNKTKDNLKKKYNPIRNLPKKENVGKTIVVVSSHWIINIFFFFSKMFKKEAF